MQRRNIVLITPIFPPGGGGAAVVHYQLCKQLGSEACAVVLSADGEEAARFDRAQTFPVVCIGGLDSLYWILPLVRRISQSKVVFYIHGEEVPPGNDMGPISKRLYHRS